jgi:hypothetical protein
VRVDGHHEPAVVVEAPSEELLTEPVLPKAEELEPDEPEPDEPELEELEALDELDESVELDVVPDPLVVETATVPDWLDAYASAR